MIVCEGGGGGEPEGDAVGKGRTYGHDEGVAEPGHAVRELVRELDVVVVDPTTGDDGDAVEASHARLGEETGEDVANDAADGM